MGSRERAFRLWNFLSDNGLFTTLSIAPAVPPGKDLVRTSMSARHTDEDLDKITDVFTRAAKKF